MPVARSARQAGSRDANEVNPKRAGSWLREQRQKAGLSQMDLANKLGFKYYAFISRSKTALVVFRPKVWATGHGHLVFGLRSLLAFCSVTMIRRYSMPCSRMERNERGLPGCRSEERTSGGAERLEASGDRRTRVSITPNASMAVQQSLLMARRTSAIRNSMFWTAVTLSLARHVFRA